MNLIEQIKVNDVSIDGYQGTYYSESPEWVRVILDSEDKVLAGIKADGTVEWSEGVPTPVKEYVEDKIESIDLSGAESMSYADIPEYIQVTTDSEDKILMGIKENGAVYIPILENDSIDLKIDDAIEGIDASVNEMLNKVGPLKDYFYEIDDPEKRSEIKTDNEDKLITYIDKNGVFNSLSGIKTSRIELSDDGIEEFKNVLNSLPEYKKWYLPKFGKVNIKEEIFYLDAVDGFDSENDVVCIQMYDDNQDNAYKRLTLSQYYLKSSLTPLSDGTYGRDSVTVSSIALELHAGKDVVAIGNKYFATAIYTPIMDGEYIIDYTKNKATKVLEPETGDVIGYEYNGNSTEVKQIIDVPPYKAWKVNKNIEHFCVADIDFSTFYNKSNVSISIKYQGSASTRHWKKGLRITFYKNNTYTKKDKIKIGEMVRLSGFNMKSYGIDSSRIKDPIISWICIEMWNTRGEDAYPWNKDSVPYNGATGFIKSFPIETWFGEEFFGIQFFSLKKDEKNYMLDGDDDSSGIFVSGAINSPTAWIDASHNDWEDEMMDEMSLETADALDELFKYTKGFIEGSIEIDGLIVEFENSMLEEHIDLKSWIDYYIIMQIFQLWDNSYHNIILHSRSDKKKFYTFLYDVDNSLQYAYDKDIIGTSYVGAVDYSFWEKLGSEYKDSIINRYSDLRKNVLMIENIKNIYQSYIVGIPGSVIDKEVARWGNGNPKDFDKLLTLIDKRLNWLDTNYFKL